jgi:hypothetical protein
MVNHVYLVRKVLVLAALAGLGVRLVPDLAGVASHLVRWGPEGLAIADLAADITLLAVLSLAAVGVARRRSWGRWVGRGAGLYVLAGTVGGFAVFGTLRPLDALAALAAGVLVISLPAPDEEYLGGPPPERGDPVRRWLGGWVLAFNAAAIAALLASVDQTTADALRDTLSALWLVSGGLAALAAIGAALLLASRASGLLACALADLAALAYYRELVVPGPELGHHELVILLPAAAAAVVAAAVIARPSLASLTARSPRPIL